jgi:hypothetical protein
MLGLVHFDVVCTESDRKGDRVPLGGPGLDNFRLQKGLHPEANNRFPEILNLDKYPRVAFNQAAERRGRGWG